jgi:hypothetical protein
MKLSEITRQAQLALRAGATSYDKKDIESALIPAAMELLEEIPVLVVSNGAVTCTADNAELDFSSVTGFSAEAIKQVEIGYTKSTWATATAYTADLNLVTGDGSPDSKLYLCTTSHTSGASTEPPGSNWTQVLSNQGTRVNRKSYQDIMGKIRNLGTTVDRPQEIGWENENTAFLWPAPDLAYPVDIIYEATLDNVNFDPDTDVGTLEVIDVTIPDRYVTPLAWWGIPAVLTGEARYEVKWDKWLRKTKGKSNPGSRLQLKNSPYRGGSGRNSVRW